MNKAFTREPDADADDAPDEEPAAALLPQGARNYLTPAGYRRLREIDRRIRFLTKRLDIAEIVDPSLHHGRDQVFFGATVRYANQRGELLAVNRETVAFSPVQEPDVR